MQCSLKSKKGKLFFAHINDSRFSKSKLLILARTCRKSRAREKSSASELGRRGGAEPGRQLFAHVLDNIDNSVFGPICTFRIIEIPIGILTFSRSRTVSKGRAGTAIRTSRAVVKKYCNSFVKLKIDDLGEPMRRKK